MKIRRSLSSTIPHPQPPRRDPIAPPNGRRQLSRIRSPKVSRFELPGNRWSRPVGSRKLWTPDRCRSLRNRVRGRLYNGFDQLISRVITNSGTANGTTYFVHDLWGNVIAELTTAGATVREYIYLPEAEIAPTMGSRTQVDIPVAVVDGVNTTPVTYNVHVDHLGRPVRMTNSAKASVWSVEYTPWGAPHAITGAQTLNTRFPGQWFQLESGLHYNWHRHYDPSLGRYTQPDPLGFVDGPSVYGYARSSPIKNLDFRGLEAGSSGPSPGGLNQCTPENPSGGPPPTPPPPRKDERCKSGFDSCHRTEIRTYVGMAGTACAATCSQFPWGGLLGVAACTASCAVSTNLSCRELVTNQCRYACGLDLDSPFRSSP